MLAHDASGCASSPLHPCGVTPSRHVHSCPPHQPPVHQAFDSREPPAGGVFYTRFSWAGASGHLLPAPVSWSPKLVRNFLGIEWGRSRHFSLQRPVTAAPAQLHACGYRSLTLLATESVGLAGPQVSMQRGWQPPRTVQWQVLSPLVLAAHEVCAV